MVERGHIDCHSFVPIPDDWGTHGPNQMLQREQFRQLVLAITRRANPVSGKSKLTGGINMRTFKMSWEK